MPLPRQQAQQKEGSSCSARFPLSPSGTVMLARRALRPRPGVGARRKTTAGDRGALVLEMIPEVGASSSSSRESERALAPRGRPLRGGRVPLRYLSEPRYKIVPNGCTYQVPGGNEWPVRACPGRACSGTSGALRAPGLSRSAVSARAASPGPLLPPGRRRNCGTVGPRCRGHRGARTFFLGAPDSGHARYYALVATPAAANVRLREGRRIRAHSSQAAP